MTSARSRERVPCPACGEPSPVPTNWPDPDPWACSPCRAEYTGSIHVTLPWACSPGSFLGGPAEPESLREALLSWAKALAAATAGVLELVGGMGGAPVEEEVAHAIMGGAPDLQLEAMGDCLKIGGLTPEGARLLAQRCEIAGGPHLTNAKMSDLLRDASLARDKA